MQLIRQHWEKGDIEDFEKYLYTLSKGEEKGAWEKRIINTNLNCIAVPSNIVSNIVRDISKGNFIEFIDFWLWNNYTETAIIGKLICKIKDFEKFSYYLTEYANRADNWATCDCLKFKITSFNKQDYFDLAQKLIKSNKTFVKRTGLNIIMELLKYDEFLDKIFTILNSFTEETEYYVNMMLAWIVCESFIKHRDETLNFLKTHKLNKFTINKAISKCHDSFRVTREDKEMLKTFRI